MCSRFALTHSAPAVRRHFGFAETADFPPRYNIAPTQPIAVVLSEGGGRHFRLMRWGFLPGLGQGAGRFPSPVQCPRRDGGRKAGLPRRHALPPLPGAGVGLVRMAPARPDAARRSWSAAAMGPRMALAGLWETWSAADGSEIDTAAIVTTAANGSLAAIDERMPVVVAPADFDAWLDTRSTPLKEATRLVRPAPDALFEMVAIGPHVGNPRHEGPHVQEPACEPPLPRRDAPGAGGGPGDKGGQGSLF